MFFFNIYLKVLNETLVIYNVSQHSSIDYQISQIKSRFFHTDGIATPTMIFKVLIDWLIDCKICGW